MKTTLTTLAFVAAAMTAQAAPVKYSLDASHSQIVFSYNHIGFSTTYGMYSGFDGEIMFDADSPENSSVSVTMPTRIRWPTSHGSDLMRRLRFCAVISGLELLPLR